MKIIIPMAGNGSRFKSVGYVNPKPFIDMGGLPMIKHVVNSINLPEFEYIFIVKRDHEKLFNIDNIFNDLKHRIISIDHTTIGAAITVSLAGNMFERDEEILIVNSDQLLYYDSNQVRDIIKSEYDGCIWCFEGNGPKWSYVKIIDNLVCEVAEKKQISNIATGGMYYWKSFYNYLECLRKMIQANDTVNNEFYVAPVYNYMLKKQKIAYRMLDGIDQLGTPEELQEYENKIRLYRDNKLL